MKPKTLVHVKNDISGTDRDGAIKAVEQALQHLAGGFNDGHGHTSDDRGRYVIQYDEGSDQ